MCHSKHENYARREEIRQGADGWLCSRAIEDEVQGPESPLPLQLCGAGVPCGVCAAGGLEKAAAESLWEREAGGGRAPSAAVRSPATQEVGHNPPAVSVPHRRLLLVQVTLQERSLSSSRAPICPGSLAVLPATGSMRWPGPLSGKSQPSWRRLNLPTHPVFSHHQELSSKTPAAQLLAQACPFPP